MGLVVGMQRILVARNWTVWCRFLGDLGDWPDETAEKYIDEDDESCWSNECVRGEW